MVLRLKQSYNFNSLVVPRTETGTTEAENKLLDVILNVSNPFLRRLQLAILKYTLSSECEGQWRANVFKIDWEGVARRSSRKWGAT